MTECLLSLRKPSSIMLPSNWILVRILRIFPANQDNTTQYIEIVDRQGSARILYTAHALPVSVKQDSVYRISDLETRLSRTICHLSPYMLVSTKNTKVEPADECIPRERSLVCKPHGCRSTDIIGTVGKIVSHTGSFTVFIVVSRNIRWRVCCKGQVVFYANEKLTIFSASRMGEAEDCSYVAWPSQIRSRAKMTRLPPRMTVRDTVVVLRRGHVGARMDVSGYVDEICSDGSVILRDAGEGGPRMRVLQIPSDNMETGNFVLVRGIRVYMYKKKTPALQAFGSTRTIVEHL